MDAKRMTVLSETANTGMGLWTSICVLFCGIFGRESLALKKKQDRILSTANRRLIFKLQKLGPGYAITDYRVVYQSTLSVTVSGIAVLEKTDAK